jgi:hypothetical protein
LHILFNTHIREYKKKEEEEKNLKFKPTNIVFYDKQLSYTLLSLAILNNNLKEAKIETYLLYPNFTGKPRLLDGLLKDT